MGGVKVCRDNDVLTGNGGRLVTIQRPEDTKVAGFRAIITQPL